MRSSKNRSIYTLRKAVGQPAGQRHDEQGTTTRYVGSTNKTGVASTQFSNKYRLGARFRGTPIQPIAENTWFKTAGPSLLLYALAGLIGNRFDAGIVNGALWISDYLTTPQTADTRLWFVGILSATVLFYAFLVSYRNALFQDLDRLALEQQKAQSDVKRLQEVNTTFERKNAGLRRALVRVRTQAEELTESNVTLKAENQQLREASTLQKSALRRLEDVAELDLDLLTFLVPLLGSPAEAREQVMLSVLRKVLQDVAIVFEADVCRTSVLRPDSKGEYLEWWEHYGMPKEALRNDRFYIGEGKTIKRGVAAVAFRTKEPQVVHITKRGSQYYADHPQFSFRRGSMKPLDYSSAAVLPIIGPDDSCLGVLCVDSKQLTTFDQAEVIKFLDDLATRLAVAISTYHYMSAVNRSLQVGKQAS